MVYRPYGGGPADQLVAAGSGAPGSTASVWTAASGGSQVVDLVDGSGVPTDHVTADQFGLFGFQAPGGLGTLWIDPGVGGDRRFAVQPTDLGDRLVTLELGAGSVQALRVAADRLSADFAAATTDVQAGLTQAVTSADAAQRSAAAANAAVAALNDRLTAMQTPQTPPPAA